MILISDYYSYCTFFLNNKIFQLLLIIYKKLLKFFIFHLFSIDLLL